jgi:hypothetical protein
MKKILFFCFCLNTPFLLAQQFEWAIEPQFLDADPFVNGKAAVQTSDGKCIFINTSGSFLGNSVCEVFGEGLHRSTNEAGGAYTYDEWTHNQRMNGDKNGKCGMLWNSTKNNKNVKYRKVLLCTVAEYPEGLTAVQLPTDEDKCGSGDDFKGKWGFVDRDGKVIIPFILAHVFSNFENGEAYVNPFRERIYDRTVINKAGKYLVDYNKYSYCERLSEDLRLVRNTKNLYGFLDQNGRAIIEPIFEGARSFKDGLALVRYNGKWGYIKNPLKSSPKPSLLTITWESPSSNYTSISSTLFNIRACVRSQTPVTKTTLYIDELPYQSRDWDIVPSNDCQVVMNQSISLQHGAHRLKITATNEGGTVTSEERTIEVQGSQPNPITISNNYALLIAVQNYTDPNINSLNKPIEDAEALQSVLVSKYGFPTHQVTLLRSPTKSEIVNALIQLRNLSSQDNLLLYYGGHGTMDGNLGFWLPSNATKRNRDNWLSNSDVIGYIGRIPSKHTLALVDACFGGSLIMRDLGEEHACEIQGSLTSRQAMTSGTKTVVPDESVFMRYLIKKLNENTESCLAADKLFNLLKTPVINNSPIKQVPLMSPIPSTGDEGGSFIFRLRY